MGLIFPQTQGIRNIAARMKRRGGPSKSDGQSVEWCANALDDARAEVVNLKAKVATLLHDVEDATAFVTEVALAFGCEPDDPGLLALVKEAAPKKTGDQ